jgi:hypothetical protein
MFEVKSNLFRFIKAKLTLAPLGMPKERLTLSEPISLFKPPHYLKACTKNIPNMEGDVCKTTNFQPKVHLN